jgi:iron complex transport system substrate-binding protein
MVPFKNINYIALIVLFYLLTFSFFSSPTYAASCTVVDGFNHKITLKKPAKRIVSLASNLTEILFNIGAGDQVVGVIAGCDYPMAARKVRCIGSKTKIDTNKIKTMRPDLIVTWKDTFSQQLVDIGKIGVPIYITNPHQLEDIPVMMKNLGCLSGRVKEAMSAANNFTSELEKIKKQNETKKPLTVFFQVGAYSLVTISKHSWINQVITVCGGRNVFPDKAPDAVNVDLGSITLANPEVIISDAVGEPWQDRWKAFDDITAVKNNQLFTIDPNLVNEASPRILEGTEKICKLLQTARAKKSTPIVA